jgi:hypothetical protein
MIAEGERVLVVAGARNPPSRQAERGFEQVGELPRQVDVSMCVADEDIGSWCIRHVPYLAQASSGATKNSFIGMSPIIIVAETAGLK